MSVPQESLDMITRFVNKQPFTDLQQSLQPSSNYKLENEISDESSNTKTNSEDRKHAEIECNSNCVHGICAYDEVLEKSRCFCYSNFMGT